MKVIIAGSRSITDYETVDNAINHALMNWRIKTVRAINEVISGGANGVDRLGERWARLNNIPIVILYASWAIQGRAAGPIRNQEMVNRADALIAVWDGKSKGTQDIIDRANKKGIKVYVYNVIEATRQPEVK